MNEEFTKLYKTDADFKDFIDGFNSLKKENQQRVFIAIDLLKSGVAGSSIEELSNLVEAEYIKRRCDYGK